MDTRETTIAVLLPCYNEEITIAKVIADYRRELPLATVWVFDNNSKDRSAELAAAAGAVVRPVSQQGKGHVVRRMFQEVDADCYVMVDSDDTYPADEVHKLIRPILEGQADMVNGDRLSSTYASENKRKFHNFGNGLVCWLIGMLFRRRVSDVMTGYRAFSRAFVKSCPVLAQGFEIETELTLHTLDKRFALLEVPVAYRDRPAGSVSKLNTFRDGFLVIKTIFNLFRYYRPFLFFGIVSAAMLMASFILFVPVFMDYLRTGLVPRFPTLIVSGLMALSALLALVCGIVLDTNKKYTDQIFELLIAKR